MENLCKCGKPNNEKHADRHADGTLKQGNSTGAAAAAHARKAIGKNPRKGNGNVALLRMMKVRWNTAPTSVSAARAKLHWSTWLSPSSRRPARPCRA